MNGNRLKKITKHIGALFLSGARYAYSFLQKNALTERGLVSIFLVMFAMSAVFLDTKIGRDLDPNAGKDWWTLSFETRDEGSLEFAIENYSSETDFSYSVTRDKIVLDKGTVSVDTGARAIITPLGNGDTAGRTTIIVESGDGSKKSIYRERN